MFMFSVIIQTLSSSRGSATVEVQPSGKDNGKFIALTIAVQMQQLWQW